MKHSHYSITEIFYKLEDMGYRFLDYITHDEKYKAKEDISKFQLKDVVRK